MTAPIKENTAALNKLLEEAQALPEAGTGSADAVLYTPQELTDEQKTQARSNIGALAELELDEAIDDALAQAKASGEFKGEKGDTGANGVSATHSWNGTTLTITSASGTSSADLKGDKGDKGSDATVTAANIESALGFKPASAEVVDGLSKEVTDLGESKQPAGDYALRNELPKNTSDLNNDSGYVTIAVATLLNYYLKTETYAKTETYSQTEVDNLISGLDGRLKAIADSDDITLDQLSEIVAYIKSNKSLIDSITTSKVNISDIVDNLTTADAKKPLSAAQGKELKTLYDSLPTWAKAASKPSYSKSEIGLGNVDNVKQYSASNPPPYPVISVNGKTGAANLTASDVGARPSTWMPSASDVGAPTTAQFASLASDVGGKLAKNHGSANVGKILVVGSDGNLTLTAMPEASGDVVGTLDESKNILLTGTLADGTYPLKYKRNDGTYADAGTLTVSQIVTPSYTNLLPLAIASDGAPFNGGQGWKTGYRLNSSGNESADSGLEVTGFIPVKYGDTVHLKDIEWKVNSGNNSCKAYVWVYTSDFAVPSYKSGYSMGALREIDDVSSKVTVDANGNLAEFEISNELFKGFSDYSTIAYMRISAYGITDQSIITVNEEIV